MDTNASLRRFYASTTNTSATLPSSASSPDPQSRRGSSGSDSLSDDDGSASQRSHPPERALLAYGNQYAPYGVQNPSLYTPNRAEPTSTTVYVDDAPYIPPGSTRSTQASTHVESGPDVPFNPSIQNYNAGISSSLAPATLHPTTFRRSSGDSSPTGSNGSGGSDHSGGVSGSSQGSASSGVASYGSPQRGPVYHAHDVFPPRQRAAPPPGFNPEHYPAYDEHFRRVGMEHARFGTDPRQPDNAYYRPRTHTYPPVGAPQAPLGMDSSEPAQMYPSPEPQLLQMNTDNPSVDRDPRHEQVIPGQTRIYLPSEAVSQSHENFTYGSPSSSVLRSGDDAYIPTSDADIRRFLGLSPDQELSLNALADPPPGQRPGQSIPTLSQLAILGSQSKRLTLQEIYQALEERFEWFHENRHDKSWQNSIRHNLSLYKCFRRIPKPITEPGKGSYWVVDYSRGAGTKRPRKRNKRKTKAELRAEAEAEGRADLPAEDDSSPDGGDDDEDGFPSPAYSAQDFPLDPALQGYGHQVGQVRARPSTRSIARRGNSPYSQGTQLSVQGRHSRQNATNAVATANANTPVSRQPSATFGQPSLGPPSFSPTIFGQSAMGGVRTAPANWQPGMHQPNPVGGQLFLPPPSLQPRAMNAVTGPVPLGATHVHSTPTRVYTLPNPSHMAQDMRSASYAQLPPLQGMEQLRDPNGRFMASGAGPAQQAATGGSSQQHFVQASSRGGGGRRTSSSSRSSQE